LQEVVKGQAGEVAEFVAGLVDAVFELEPVEDVAGGFLVGFGEFDQALDGGFDFGADFVSRWGDRKSFGERINNSKSFVFSMCCISPHERPSNGELITAKR